LQKIFVNVKMSETQVASDIVNFQNEFNKVIQTFNHFKWSSGFPLYLNTAFGCTGSDLTGDAKITMGKLKDNTFTTYNLLLQEFNKVNIKYPSPNPNQSKEAASNPHYYLEKSLLFGSSTANSKEANILTFLNNIPYCSSIVNNFQIKLNPIETYEDLSGNNAYPTDYRLTMRTAHIDTFALLYGQVAKNICDSGNSSQCGIVFITPISLRQKTADLLTYIEFKVYQYINQVPNNQSLETYLENLYQDVLQDQTVVFDKFHKHFFLATCFPYFQYLYLLSFIPSPEISSSNKAPRNGVIRGLAIMATYKFILYFLYGVYQTAAAIDPSNPVVAQLRSIIDKNVTTLFNTELANYNSALTTVPVSTDALSSNMKNLDSIQQQVTMARSNVTNIANNQAGVQKKANRVATYKWVWLSMLILYILVAISLLTMIALKVIENQRQNFLSSIVISSSIIIVVVTIFALI